MTVHYTTVGEPDGEPVLVLHGTNGTGGGMVSEGFAGALFGPGQPLDAAEHYLVLSEPAGKLFASLPPSEAEAP